jgi:hypothetical protein
MYDVTSQHSTLTALERHGFPRPEGPGFMKAAELEGPYRTERFEPCSLRLRAALPNSAPSGFL